MIKVSIIGTGQIGYDLLFKILKLDFIEFIAFVGRRKNTKEIPNNIIYSDKSIEYFILNPKCCDVVFDCTDAYSAKINYKIFMEQGLKVIDLTPSNIGDYYIPNITIPLNQNINMVTCGGQVSIPILKYLYNKCAGITYVEIITQISSESAGMATRVNIDKYIETTENAIYKIVGIKNSKVILNINPGNNITMQTTIFIKLSTYDIDNIDDFDSFVNIITKYIPNYNISKPTLLSSNILMININVLSSSNYISKYAGNLDIINCSAIHALKTINYIKYNKENIILKNYNNNNIKISDIICSFLINRNIDVVFGIIGSANSHLYDSFKNYNIRIINVHNEQCAVMAAGAYFRASGKLAIALVTAGGGASNSVTGILSLWADSIPTIILSGQESSYYINEHNHRRMYGTQGFDFIHMISKSTKYSKCIVDPLIIQDELEKSYSFAMDGRKGPVVLDIPFDIQSKKIEYRFWNNYIPKIINNGISNIEELILNSKYPVILAGHGIKLSNSTELFKEILQNIQIPVLLTWSGIDILYDEHPLYFGRPGIYGQRAANFILQKSDLLITIGTRLTLPQTGYDFEEFARKSKIVMVDVDTTEFKPFANLCINTDCNEFFKQIKNIKYINKEWIKECNNLLINFPLIENYHKDDIFPNSYKIIDKISDYLKPSHIIVTDMGTALLSGHYAIRLKEGNTMFSSYGLGEMGYGLPAALGAAISSKERDVLCLNCDGSMMMNLQELQTIIQHKLNIKIIIFNNDGYLMIKHTQKMLFNGIYNSVDSNTGIVLPDYMRIADAFGYEKIQIKSWDDFYLYFPKFMDCYGPGICEIFMNPNQDFIPKVKGVVNNNNEIFAPPIEEMSPLLEYDIIKSVMNDNISKKSNIISRI